MSDKRNRIGRIFMLVFGIILFLAGLIVVFSDRENMQDALIGNSTFFLTGGFLIFLGLTWKKNGK